MTNNHDLESSRYFADGKPAELMNKRDGAKRRLRGAPLPADEYTKFTSYVMPYRQAYQPDGKHKDDASTGEYPSSFVGEPLYEQDYDFSTSRTRKIMSRYAAPTKASRAKNEKVDVAPTMKRKQDRREYPTRPPSAMQRPSSVTSDYKMNSPYHNLTSLGNDKDEMPAKGHLSRSMSEHVWRHGQARSCSADSSDVEQASRNVTAILHHWKQEKADLKEAQVGSLSIDDHEYLGKDDKLMDMVEELRREFIAAQKRNAELEMASESQGGHIKELEERCAALENRLESAPHHSIDESTSHDTQNPAEALDVVLGKVIAEKQELEFKLQAASSERDGAVERIDSVQQELRNAKGEVKNLGKDNEKLLIKTQKLETEIKERDEAVKDELQSNKTDAEDWRRKYDAMAIRARGFEEQIEARNCVEPVLPLNEAIVAESKRLQSELREMRSRVDQVQKGLKAKRKKLNQMTESAQQFDHEISESNDTMNKLQNSINNLSDILKNVSQANADEKIISLSHIDILI